MEAEKRFSDELRTLDAKFSKRNRPVSEDEIRRGELEALFNVYAQDTPKKSIDLVASIQSDLQIQQSRLLILFRDKIIDSSEYAKALNHELTWSMRRCSVVLGEAKCAELFGFENLQHIELIDPVAIDSPDPAALVARYKPKKQEQQRLLALIPDINPQDQSPSLGDRWGRRSKYWGLISQIDSAEDSYNCGKVQESILHASRVVSAVDELQSISDMPMYLAAWAEHIQGRGYDALANNSGAMKHYRASLAIKDQLIDWLPALPRLTTEVKLGCAALIGSAADSRAILWPVIMELQSKKATAKFKTTNLRLYQNLLEDSLFGHAEARFATGERDGAVKEARMALRLAKQLKDSVGELRVTIFLCKVNDLTFRAAELRIDNILSGHHSLSRHPRVATILEEFRESHLTPK